MQLLSFRIHKLGLIQEADEIRLNRLMIFSGESGLGKSYLAMLCHYFFDVLLDRSRISSFFEEKGFIYDELRPAFKNEGTAVTFRKKDFEDWLATDAIKYLEYMINAELPDARIEVYLPDAVDDEITIRYAEELTGLVNNEETYLRLSLASLTTRVKDNGFHEESPFSFIFRFYLIKCIFGDHTSLKDSFVFPPSRGPVLTEEIRPITGMYSKFKDCLYKLKRPVREGEESYRTVAALFSQVLNGTVSYTDGNYVYQTEGTELPISAAAASIRELAPIEQMVKKVDLSKTALLIEEPEAHLHPLKQRMMADITSGMLHTGAFMQVTTHSDYYLRRINELILLNRLSNREDFKAIAEKLGVLPELAIDTATVSAYLLERGEDGHAKVIRQNLSEGVPFASFHAALRESLTSLAELNRLISDYGRD